MASTITTKCITAIAKINDNSSTPTKNSISFPSLTEKPSETCTVKRLWLIRHGETPQNAMRVLQGGGIDPELSDRGTQQANCLKDRLKSEHFDLFISSDMKRAIKTAEIVKQYHENIPLEKFSDLKELSWGVWEGTTAAENDLKQLIQAWNEGYFDEKAPNGESPLEVEERSVNTIYNIIKSNSEKQSIAMILHGRLLRIILSSLLYQDLFHMASFTHHNTTINILDVIIEHDDEAIESTTSKVEKLKEQFKIDKEFGSLDDNVEILNGPASSVSALPPSLSPNSQNPVNRPEHLPKTGVEHPRNFFFVPVALDDRAHLPSELN